MPSWTDRPKRVLFHGASSDSFDRYVRSLTSIPGCVVERDREIGVSLDGQKAQFQFHGSVSDLLADLRHNYVNLLVVDLRGTGSSVGPAAARILETIDILDRTEDLEDRYPFHRILAIVGGEATTAVDALILELGARGIGRVLRQADATHDHNSDVSWAHHLNSEVWRILGKRRPGKRALCAAGGGITGIFFEVGALKCLDDCLGPGGVNAFDLYFGISAGAIVASTLAVGYSVDELMAAIAGLPGSRIPPLDLRLFRLSHLDTRGFLRRLKLATQSAWAGIFRAFRGGPVLSGERLVFETSDLVAPPFRAHGFEEMLRKTLTAPGATNDFRRLARPLFIGATDQDTRRHVLFGDEDHDDVPISQAVQASFSVNPAFSATVVQGRYYEDGAVTRTSNFVEAIHRGATLIFVLDPFVPYVARTPGYTDQKGVLYNLDQDVRTVSYTRYETTRNWVLRKHPEASSYTFVPANRLRRLISNNPMDHRPFLEVWRGAYLSTLTRLHHVHRRIEGDLVAHGVAFNLDRAEAVAERLAKVTTPRFEDFFPDGKVDLLRPPLPNDADRQPGAASDGSPQDGGSSSASAIFLRQSGGRQPTP